MKRTLELIALVAVIASGAYLFGTCAGSKRAEWSAVEENAYRLARQARPLREAIVQADRTSDSLRSAMGRSEDRVEVGDALLGQQLDANRVLLANVNATNAELRQALERTTMEADTFRLLVDRYRDSANYAVQAAITERFANQRLRATQDSALRAFKDLAESRDCKVLGVSCPTRTTSFFAGGLVATVVILLLL